MEFHGTLLFFLQEGILPQRHINSRQYCLDAVLDKSFDPKRQRRNERKATVVEQVKLYDRMLFPDFAFEEPEAKRTSPHTTSTHEESTTSGEPDPAFFSILTSLQTSGLFMW